MIWMFCWNKHVCLCKSRNSLQAPVGAVYLFIYSFLLLLLRLLLTAHVQYNTVRADRLETGSSLWHCDKWSHSFNEMLLLFDTLFGIIWITDVFKSISTLCFTWTSHQHLCCSLKRQKYLNMWNFNNMKVKACLSDLTLSKSSLFSC